MEYMDGTIKTEKHLNEDAFLLENDVLSVKILKNFGAKIASIYSKEKNFEFLFQPTKVEYEVPVLRDAFEKYDTSGADDMLPTIDECFYPNSYIKLPDHGDVWAQKWNYEVEDNKLIAWIRSDSLKLILKRTMYLEDNALVLEYSLKNNTLQKHYYLWAFHGLMNFDDNTEMYFDFSGEIENVIDATEYGFDFKKLYEYPDKSQNKFYFKNEVENGSCGLIYKNQGLKLQYDFDTNINKYVGVWITKGGFKNEYNVAIEPASGYYDSLERAFKNNKVSSIEPGEELYWSLKLSIEDIEV